VELVKKVGIGGMWIEKLLGYPNLVKHTLEYIKNTIRFEFGISANTGNVGNMLAKIQGRVRQQSHNL
jgi:hypothetical protein